MAKDDKNTPPDAPPVVMPSLVGISPEQLAAILGALASTSAGAMKAALKSQQRENPNYPGRSVFDPNGAFDDEGMPVAAPKPKLARETFFVGVRLSDELMTEEEVNLCNRFKPGHDKYSRDGLWKAEFQKVGAGDRLLITVPCKTVDDRMGLPPFTHILRELLLGPDAVNVESQAKQIEALQHQVAELISGRQLQTIS